MNGSRWFVRLQAGALALAFSAVLVNSAHAALLAYEPFNYPTGQIFTDNIATATTASFGGDFGWREVWRSNGASADTNTISIPGSFNYVVGGRRLQVLGNRWWDSGKADAAGDNFTPPGIDAATQPYRRLTVANSRGYSVDTDSTTWISLLAQVATVVPTAWTGAGADGGTIRYGRGVGPFQMFNNAADFTGDSVAAGTENLSIGRGTQSGEQGTGAVELGYANDTWGILNRGAAPQTKVSDNPLNELAFILVRIDHKAGISTGSAADDAFDDTAYMWINPPSLTVEPAIGTAELTINVNSFSGPPTSIANSDRDYNFNRIRLFAGQTNGAPNLVGYNSVQMDEFRIGETFDDVTPDVEIPEPGSAVLAAFGLIALAARRRK